MEGERFRHKNRTRVETKKKRRNIIVTPHPRLSYLNLSGGVIIVDFECAIKLTVKLYDLKRYIYKSIKIHETMI